VVRASDWDVAALREASAYRPFWPEGAVCGCFASLGPRRDGCHSSGMVANAEGPWGDAGLGGFRGSTPARSDSTGPARQFQMFRRHSV
jgi:hypothetical protein